VADVADIAAVDPALELTLGQHSLVCRGTLDARTRRYVLDAASTLLARHPGFVTVDISELRVADVEGANTFATLKRLAREAGAELRWRGLQSERLQGILPLDPLSARGTALIGRGRPSPSGRREVARARWQ
jgi:anti-anti-sigma regulatory factor